VGTYVHLASPILNMLARGLFITSMYALILWVIDPRVRVWAHRAYEIGRGMWQRRSESHPVVPEIVNAAPEQPTVSNAPAFNPDIDGRRETVQCI
jgi:hypothetical protein